MQYLPIAVVFLLTAVVLVPLFKRLQLGAVLGLGGAQVAVCGLLLGLIAMALGLSWQAAFVVGAGLAMSSTALVLSSLSERGQLAARHGRDAFAVLLFQDLAVI